MEGDSEIEGLMDEVEDFASVAYDALMWNPEAWIEPTWAENGDLVLDFDRVTVEELADELADVVKYMREMEVNADPQDL